MSDDGRRGPAMNALKHGILAKSAAVTTKLASSTQESEAALQAIIEDLVRHYSPDGPVEEMLVEEIAVTYWRRRRVLWLESAQVASNMDGAPQKAARDTEKIERSADKFWDRAEAIRKTGKLDEVELQEARGYFGRQEVDPEEWVSVLEGFSDAQVSKSEATYNRSVQMQSAPDFSDQRWDLILRYDKHLANLLHKTIDKLHVLQAARKAEDPVKGKGKPRRGRSKAEPKFALLAGGRR